jgi:hypothetical protein
MFWSMRAVPRLRCLVSGFVLVAASTIPARANWEETPPSGVRHFFRDRNIGVAFNSLSATQWGATFTTGAKVAFFARRDQTGPRLLFFSTEKLRERDPLIAGRFNQFGGTRVLGGYEWHREGLVVSAYGGASLIMHSPWEVAVTRYHARIGVAGGLEFWKSWQAGSVLPVGFSSGTLMFDAAERSLFARMRYGIATGISGIAIGPDLSISTGTEIAVGRMIARGSWLKTRIGIHATGFRFGQLGLNLSGGYEHRNRERSGGYAEVTMLWYY